ncbi:unnamed protein product [Cyclocybe aegerita]|uniref:YTH domain-containing protein n=1 Tax=Cyclocybe aegerita TaxID=1973307 RepID=A0A8S0WA65_CYCAE|nr:unnamed protein product [Cyclocybe aegerita]
MPDDVILHTKARKEPSNLQIKYCSQPRNLAKTSCCLGSALVMVEAQLGEPVLRARTPTPGRYSSHPRFSGHDDPGFESPRLSRNSPELYDQSATSTPTLIAEDTGTSGSDIDVSDSMRGDDSKSQMSDSPRPDPAIPSSSRRRPRTQLTHPQRPSPSPHPSQSSSSHAYPIPSPTSSSENIHNRPPAGFQGSSLHYPSSPVSYAQRPSYVGQYTISPQPSPITMAPYAFPHTYHHPGVPDSSMMSQSIHANYQPMLQHHAPVYSYQRPSPDGGSSSHPSFSGTRTPMYPPHQTSPSTPSTSPHMASTSGQSSALATSYVGTGFQSLRYPSPMSSTPYPYPTQSYQASPMYQSQYPPPYGQHYTPPAETEPQGAWFYLPHANPMPSPRQYDGGQPYYSPVTYARIGPPDDGSYGAGPSPSTVNPPAHTDPALPSVQRFTQHAVEGHTTLGSPRASGAGPPAAPAAPSVSSSNAGPPPPITDKPVVRRSYHPNPPAHRSEWVMWAGNVPSDATHDELWRFFNQANESSQVEDAGVMSIFLISRSSCAFVNYENEEFLHEAIKMFNGVPLRANDPRCARLVCRVRRKDDDLKAGVGGQRGMGMHTRYVREQKGKAREGASSDVSASDDLSTSPTSISSRLAAAISTVSISSDEGEHRRGVHAKHSSSSGSYTSTNSSFLTRHFPRRYFILKSLTQSDLDLSVRTGLWATQKHNEEILDQAFRTSKEVYLIFGVNKSGEFFGYARMAGPVRRGEQRISWATRSSQSPTSRSAQSPLSTRSVASSSKPTEPFFSPSDHRLVDSSPLAVDGTSPAPRSTAPRGHTSAPGLLGEGYKLPTIETPKTMHSLDHRMQVEMATRRDEPSTAFELDADAPLRAVRGWQQGGKAASHTLRSVEEGDEPAAAGAEELKLTAEDSWGDSFAVEWICLERLPFPRTRHLRNPWNHDREVKVSRDGTELEPTVGQRLIEEWDKLASEPQLPPTTTAPPKPSGRRAGSGRNVPGAMVATPEGDASREGTTKGGPLRS